VPRGADYSGPHAPLHGHHRVDDRDLPGARQERQALAPRNLRAALNACFTDDVTTDGEVSETFTLVTDVLDPGVLSAEQAAAAYASRWQLETCFDELETSIRGGAAVVLRSKTPDMIRQEIYAMLCCYQAVRVLISRAADTAGLDPGRVSFTRARDGIRSRISDSGSFSP